MYLSHSIKEIYNIFQDWIRILFVPENPTDPNNEYRIVNFSAPDAHFEKYLSLKMLTKWPDQKNWLQIDHRLSEELYQIDTS